jgi:hypothetical protein
MDGGALLELGMILGMSLAPRYFQECNYESLYGPEVLGLGEIHWQLLEAANAIKSDNFDFIDQLVQFVREH